MQRVVLKINNNKNKINVILKEDAFLTFSTKSLKYLVILLEVRFELTTVKS